MPRGPSSRNKGIKSGGKVPTRGGPGFVRLRDLVRLPVPDPENPGPAESATGERSDTSFRDLVAADPLPPSREIATPPGVPSGLGPRISREPEPFEIEGYGEEVAGRVRWVDKALLRQLKQGRFRPQAELDIHGLTAAESARRVAHFVRASGAAGLGTVLVIHGRGLHSGLEGPVLQEVVVRCLTGSRAQEVLAFCSAPPRWGGPGALLVRLRGPR